MKKTIYIVLIILILPLFSQAKIPKIEFEYAGIFDVVCSQKSNFWIDPLRMEKAESSTPRFQKYWDESGTELFQTLFKIVGRDYYRSELTVYTTICNYPPMAMPLLLNVYLWIEDDNESAKDGVVQLTFHEFIHKYLKYILNNDMFDFNLLRTRYLNEAFNVKAHVHLMALEKLVYDKLGRKDLIAAAEEAYVKIIKGDYKRTWELVQVDGADQQLLDEIQNKISKNNRIPIRLRK